MKRIILILIAFTVFTSSISAQNFLEGTPEWTYCYTCETFGWYYKGETSIKYDSELEYQGSILKLFMVSSHYINPPGFFDDYFQTDSLYLYEEGEKLFKWNFPGNSKDLLYDFNAQVNDTILMRDIGNDQFYFILDSIGTTEIDGNSLKTQRLKIETSCFSFNTHVNIIDKIGAVSHDYLEIIKTYLCFEDACINAHQFQNYRNDALEIYYGSDQSCDGTTSTNNLAKSEINIFPNPATNYIQIENVEKYSKIEFFNISGQKVISQQIDGKKIEFNLESGIYIICITNKNSVISTFKTYVSKSG